eukprot:CAMPEP_0119119194 /NCGR_PEP_ID=MMETSP1310-20130426/788_1 /TAXON_ID=464262 /ORGANISM="Genus nov. species nov., Strain RCC2339" /LENGTH=572 /DNA_ID=CAMNT_0007108613 /DNA_START=281 /DNA_END=1999 /DNA_ORIENTATION=+
MAPRSSWTSNWRRMRSVYPSSEERSTAEDRFGDDFDVVIVGAGPSGLAASIRLKQLSGDRDLRIALVEKGSEVGAHILSGAVLQPTALNELIPDWKDKGAPIHTEAGEDHFYFLTKSSKFPLPVTGTPLQNHGNYIISLGRLCAWLAEQAEEMGVEVYPGISGTDVIYREDGSVGGIITGDVGIGKDGKRTGLFEPGMELRAKCTIFAEGCRGSLTKHITEKFDLRAESSPPTYGIGIKELWEIDPAKHKEGSIMHTIGWPLPNDVYGGSWMYHLHDNQVSLGFVVGLDYKNPYFNPYRTFQEFKHHPLIREQLEGGTCVKYGARALSEGGLQSLPKLVFPGGALVGDTAGFLNVAKIKGIHNSMKSGMLCAESVWEEMAADESAEVITPDGYPDKFKGSWLYEDLHAVRNFRPSFANYGLFGGLLVSGVESLITRGKLPFTLKIKHEDHEVTEPASKHTPIDYPKPDGKISFDLLTNVSRSGTNHNEDQPPHLRLRDDKIPVERNLKIYAGPESRYCPAGVYEYVEDDSGQSHLQINFSNCVHCKTCDIKDGTNIDWTPPENGGGPLYINM